MSGHGGEGAGAGGPRRRSLSAAAGRLAAALAAGALLVVGLDSVDRGLGPGADVSVGADGTIGTTDGQPPGRFASETVLACPGDDVPDSDLAVRAVSAPDVLFEEAPAARPAEGQIQVSASWSSDGTPRTGSRAGRSIDVADATDGSAVTASGGLAPAVVSGQLALSTQADGRGLALTPCQTPTALAFLVAGGAGAGQAERLVLTNPGHDPVVVDVDVLDRDGPVGAGGRRGLVIGPSTRSVLSIDALAPEVEAPVVRVGAQDGVVVAHLDARHRDGTTSMGRELVGPAAEPARELLIPALPPSPDGHEAATTLRLVAPEEDAVVELRALTPDGARSPTPGVLRVPSGSTAEVDLELPEGSALLVRSSAPVTGGMVLQMDPASDEPLDTDDATATAVPDDAATTAAPDDAATTTAPPPAREEPLVRPAGEFAWVAAVAPTPAPVGTGIPDLRALPDASAVLALSGLDATEVQVVWLRSAGAQVDTVRLDQDSTRHLAMPDGATAVWVRALEGSGTVAALHVVGADRVGPYVGAVSLPPVSWLGEVPRVRPVVP